MNAGELNPDSVSHTDEYNEPVVVENGTFSWDDDTNISSDAAPTLRNINMKVPQGSLVAVVGQVGSGKSSLLSALLGEMRTINGKVNTRGKIAYVPQQAWMQNSTLQGNITFGKRFNQELYNRVLDACALVPDLKMLPGGDQVKLSHF